MHSYLLIFEEVNLSNIQQQWKHIFQITRFAIVHIRWLSSPFITDESTFLQPSSNSQNHTNKYFRSRSYFTTDGQPASQYVLLSSPLWDLLPDITSCRKLRSCFCGAPYLTKRRVCNLQCNHSMVRVESQFRFRRRSALCFFKCLPHRHFLSI
jgi:hypothetical protein